MDFNKWSDKNMPPDIEELDIDYIRMGWNGAVETIMQIINESGCGGDSDEYIKNIISKLKAK